MSRRYTLLILSAMLATPLQLLADPPIIPISDGELSGIKISFGILAINFILAIANIFEKDKGLRIVTFLLLIPQAWACYTTASYVPLWAAPEAILIFIQLLLIIGSAGSKKGAEESGNK
jgi:hypothetical protein